MVSVTRRLALLVLLVLCTGSPVAAQGERIRVETPEQYDAAVRELEPGDTIVLANGRWRDFEVLFQGEGSPDAPITLTAETPGEVVLSGKSNLRLAGQHLVVSGLVFRDGSTPSQEVIAFRRNKDHLAHHSRVTETVIDHYNNPARRESDFWVILYGTNNRFDHNYLAGKSNVGVTLAVRLNTAESRENHHRIDHNYFGHRPVLGSNGGETLRIGTSKYSLENSFTRVENNFFEHCNGEVEIISNKSGGNRFRGNVFFESRGTLTLRHGNDNLVENNVFLGNGVDHTGGIRIINRGQTVRSNYLEGLTGHRFGSALTIMNGVPNSAINRYHRVRDALIERNSVIHSRHIQLAAGSDQERAAVPLDSVMRGNLLVSDGRGDPVGIFDDISGIRFEGNVADLETAQRIGEGIERRAVALERAENGLLYPSDPALADVGVSRDLVVTRREETGPAWYAKPERDTGFGSGETHVLTGGEDLATVLAAAASGDVIRLEANSYRVEQTIPVDKTLTLVGVGEESLIQFRADALFEMREGAALRLEGLRISGALAPGASDNSLIRTRRESMIGSYRLEIVDSVLEDLAGSPSFNVLTTARGTFASHIHIQNTRITDVSGTVLALDSESDDRGRYNVEYLDLSDSTFQRIGGALAAVYRGGTDESTFGPHVSMTGNTLIEVGQDQRAAHQASVFLHGVQDARVAGNRLVNSAPMRVQLTVGEPKFSMADNVLENTPEMEVVPAAPVN